MVKKTLTLAGALLLTGCAGYEFGDVTSRVLQEQAAYCTTSDPYERAVRRVLLERAGIDLPPKGACTDILEAFGGEVPE